MCYRSICVFFEKVSQCQSEICQCWQGQQIKTAKKNLRLKNETLAFADDLQRYQNYATKWRVVLPKMWRLKNEYISNHVYKNVAIYQNVLNRDAM